MNHPDPHRPDGSARRPALGQIGQTLTALLPFALLLVGYALAGWVNDGLAGWVTEGHPSRWGFPLHVTWPGQVDAALFGVLPSSWLQQHLYQPGEVHWYDGVVAGVSLSHYVVSPVITAVLWFRHRRWFRQWTGCVLALAFLGIATYVVFPMAPPWLASQTGDGPPVSRISNLGWDYLHLPSVGELIGSGQGVSNPVAAMPSLHAAYAALAALFFVAGAAWWARLLLLAYPVLMGVALVYTGEHYVLDVVVGWLYAVLVMLGWRATQRIRARRSDHHVDATVDFDVDPTRPRRTLVQA